MWSRTSRATSLQCRRSRPSRLRFPPIDAIYTIYCVDRYRHPSYAAFRCPRADKRLIGNLVKIQGCPAAVSETTATISALIELSKIGKLWPLETQPKAEKFASPKTCRRYMQICVLPGPPRGGIRWVVLPHGLPHIVSSKS
jgi:hypothetical protein